MVFVFFLSGAYGCLSSNRCGEGYITDSEKGCIPADEGDTVGDGSVADAVEDALTDDTTDDAEGGEEEIAEDPFKDLGKTCTAQEDCTLQASACVIMPGAAEGYCSMPECTLDPDNCPEGYYCFDATQVGQDVTICLKK
jgi:hypothetical protein